MKFSQTALAFASFSLTSAIPYPCDESEPSSTILPKINCQALANLHGASSSPQVRSEDKTKKTFTLPQVKNERFKGIDAPSSFLSIHAKYSQQLSPRIQKALQLNPGLKSKFQGLTEQKDGEEATVSVKPPQDYDSEYVVQANIGTPPQAIPMNLDTGSSDLWVLSTDTYHPQIHGQPIYHPNDSSTADRLNGESWLIRYGDGSGASGIVYQDRFALGDVSYPTQGIESAVEVSYDIASDTFSSGLIGMAASSANTVRPDKQLTFIDNIKDQLEKPLFTADLQRGKPGTYSFGSINESAYIGNITYTDIDIHVPYWRYLMSGYQIGSSSSSKHYSSFQKRSWDAIADTGTTLLLAPDDIMDDYYDQVPGFAMDEQTAMAIFPCNSVPPDFVFGIGDDYRGIIPGKYMLYANYNETYCFGGLQSSHGIPFSVAGDVLLKAQYVVFDIGQLRLGFANKKTD